MKHFILLALALSVLPLNAHNRHDKTDDEGVETQLLPRQTDEEGNKRSLITGRKKLRQHHTFNDEVEMTDGDEEVETQFLNRPVDEQGYQRSLVTGRPKMRQHHLLRSPSERQRDEEFTDTKRSKRFRSRNEPMKQTKRVSRRKYVEETPGQKRVVKQTTVKETGRNWREYLPGQE